MKVGIVCVCVFFDVSINKLGLGFYRAPLFESQTDDWECFRAVLWDPFHADCAVPQVH